MIQCLLPKPEGDFTWKKNRIKLKLNIHFNIFLNVDLAFLADLVDTNHTIISV